MSTSINPRGKTIIYFALIFSTFLYGGVVWFMFADQQPSGTVAQELHGFTAALLVLSLVSFVTALRMPADVSRWATLESICVCAVMATFMTKDWRLYAGGWVLALVGYALAFPRAEEQTTAP
jgi:hypothetical protein